MTRSGPVEPPPAFDHYVAVDWSGAKAPPLKGLKIALCAPGNAAPELVPPAAGKHWSRLDVVRWLQGLAPGGRVLAGFDFSFSGPFVDRGAYFPGSDIGGDNVHALWQAVEKISASPGDAGAADLYAGGFCRRPALGHYFLRPQACGGLYEPRLRVTEQRCREAGLGRAESLFHLIGPSQVGLGSLAGMRALMRLPAYAIWPFDAVRDSGSVAVELYTRLFLKMGGAGAAKIRDEQALGRALAALGSKPADTGGGRLDDHATDAMVAAAGLRFIAGKKEMWNPPLLSDNVRRTEGWTFGVP